MKLKELYKISSLFYTDIVYFCMKILSIMEMILSELQSSITVFWKILK